ncbi:MAG: ComF family protein [Rhodothermales bacterium]|nr:ComF family protein [Rhodothermales bacterium]
MNALLFPDRCLGCGERPDLTPWLCSGCRLSLPVADPLAVAGRADLFEPGLVGVQAAWYTEPDSPVRRLVHGVKYRFNPDLASWLGEESVRETIRPAADLIVPLPLHRVRLRERGFNQAALIGTGVSRALALPMRDVLTRTRPSGSQTRKSAAGRRDLEAGTFRARESVEGCRVLLVDDVLTTGSTLRTAAAALVAAGACEVRGLVVAASRRPGCP